MKNKVSILAVATLLIGILSIVGVSTAEAQKQARVGASASAVRSEMVVSTEWLSKNLNNPQVVVIHVARDRAHYQAGHVPGARFIGWNEITATRNGVPNELADVEQLQKVFERSGVGNEARIVLYGEMSGLAAARAYFTFDYLGHGDRAALLDGGLEKWRAEGREISTASTEIKPAIFTLRINPKVVVTFDVVKDLSWQAANVAKPNVTLIDARPAEEFSGSKPGEGVTRGGHIPGAASVFWMQNLVSKKNPVLLPAAELRRLYALAARGKKVVTYCRTGAQSSHSYFVAKYLGYEVSMYDGSYLEWSRNDRAPIVSGSQPK